MWQITIALKHVAFFFGVFLLNLVFQIFLYKVFENGLVSLCGLLGGLIFQVWFFFFSARNCYQESAAVYERRTKGSPDTRLSSNYMTPDVPCAQAADELPELAVLPEDDAEELRQLYGLR